MTPLLDPWRGGRADLSRLAGGVLDYSAGPPVSTAAFDRVADGLTERFAVTRRAPTSLGWSRAEGFERPRRDPFRGVDWGGVDLPVVPGRLRVALALRTQAAFLLFAVAALWLIGFHDTNPLWWAIGFLAAFAWTAETTRRRVGRQLARWAAEGEAGNVVRLRPPSAQEE